MSDFFKQVIRKTRAEFEFEPGVGQTLKTTRKRAAFLKDMEFSLDSKVERYVKKLLEAANQEMDELQARQSIGVSDE